MGSDGYGEKTRVFPVEVGRDVLGKHYGQTGWRSERRV